MSNSPHRSYKRITRNDLVRLAQISHDDFADLCRRQKYSHRYKGRLRLICLCQGAARHYVHHDRGVQDFDLWGFFEEVRGHPFPYRRRGERDFGPSKFGRNPDDGDAFKGRRVDVMGRSIRIPENETPIEAVQRYLGEAWTKSASLLAERPVIVVARQISRSGHLGCAILANTGRRRAINYLRYFFGLLYVGRDKMNFSRSNDESLLAFYENIRRQVEADDLQAGGRYRFAGDGVRQYADQLKEEMDRRRLCYSRIDWP